MTELEIQKRLIEIDSIIESLQQEKKDLQLDLMEAKCRRMKHRQLTIPFYD